MKICARCEQKLPIDSFQERAPGYLYRRCRKCRLEVRHERYKNYPESKLKDLERSKKWYEENKEIVSQKRKNKRSQQNKWHNIKYNHNLEKETYLLILKKQNNVCAICKQDKKLYIDHDHSCCNSTPTCGKCIRGLLCQKCNIMMHYVDECRYLFDDAIEYSSLRIVKEIYENPL